MNTICKSVFFNKLCRFQPACWILGAWYELTCHTYDTFATLLLHCNYFTAVKFNCAAIILHFHNWRKHTASMPTGFTLYLWSLTSGETLILSNCHVTYLHIHSSTLLISYFLVSLLFWNLQRLFHHPHSQLMSLISISLRNKMQSEIICKLIPFLLSLYCIWAY